VAHGENEFDTPALDHLYSWTSGAGWCADVGFQLKKLNPYDSLQNVCNINIQKVKSLLVLDNLNTTVKLKGLRLQFKKT